MQTTKAQMDRALAAEKEMYWGLLYFGFESFSTHYSDVTWDAIKTYYAEGKQ